VDREEVVAEVVAAVQVEDLAVGVGLFLITGATLRDVERLGLIEGISVAQAPVDRLGRVVEPLQVGARVVGRERELLGPAAASGSCSATTWCGWC